VWWEAHLACWVTSSSGNIECAFAAGVLEPGEARVCQVSFQAGLQPQLFSGEIYCNAAEAQAASPQDSGALPGAAGVWGQGLILEQWQTVGEPIVEDEEEIIAQDPPR
jgi:hypothetical protein